MDSGARLGSHLTLSVGVCVNLGKLLHLPGPQLSYLQNGERVILQEIVVRMK